MKPRLKGTTAWRIIAAFLFVSLAWSIVSLRRERTRFRGWSAQQTLREAAEAYANPRVNERLAIHYLVFEHARGSELVATRTVRHEARKLAEFAGLRLKLKKKVRLRRSAIDSIRDRATTSRRWQKRDVVFVFEKGTTKYVLAEVDDGSLAWLPSALYRQLRKRP